MYMLLCIGIVLYALYIRVCVCVCTAPGPRAPGLKRSVRRSGARGVPGVDISLNKSIASVPGGVPAPPPWGFLPTHIITVHTSDDLP